LTWKEFTYELIISFCNHSNNFTLKEFKSIMEKPLGPFNKK